MTTNYLKQIRPVYNRAYNRLVRMGRWVKSLNFYKSAENKERAEQYAEIARREAALTLIELETIKSEIDTLILRLKEI